MANKLPAEAFVAMAAVAWADNRMGSNEAAALHRAAEAHGLTGDDLAAVARATKERVAIDSFDASALSTWDRLITYGIASWIARLDGLTNPAEIASLRALAERLATTEVNKFKLDTAASVAFEVALQPEGRRPERYDFAKLASILRERLPGVK